MKNISAILVILLAVIIANAQTTTFTYQGKLNDGALPANGNYQVRFELYDAPQVGAGNQIGTSILVNVTVVNGIFTTQLDFGQTPFAQGQDRFLQISVRRNENEALTTLEPRQPLTSSPYSIKAKMADTAITSTNSAQLGGIAANQYVLTNDTRMSDDRNPLPNSPNYIQNATTQQASSNFNISGEGKANIFSAITQFNIGANRVLTNTGTENIFVGSDAGEDNTTGTRNAFVGFGAGRFNIGGANNSFFGSRAGRDNLTGGNNAFFGSFAGSVNTTGSNNSIFGANANLGANNLINATAIGAGAIVNTSNSLVLGNNVNVGIGTSSPTARLQISGGGFLMDNNQGFFFKDTNGANKRILLADTNNILRFGSGGAFGFDEFRFDLSTPGTVMTINSTGNVGIGTVTPNSKLTVAGLIETTTGGVKFPDGTIQTTASTGGGGNFINNSTILQSSANFNISGEGKANSFNAVTLFQLNGNRVLSNAGTANLFVGVDSGTSNTGSFNTFVGAAAGQANTTGSENTFVGRGAGANNTTGLGNSFFGRGAGLNNTTAAQNSFFGWESGLANTIGTSNSFFGAFAGRSNSDGTGNSFFGAGAGRSNNTGDSNVFVGFSSGFNNNGGSGNTFVGKSAGQANLAGNSNTFLGGNAGFANLGNDNTFLGNGAGIGNTSGGENTYVGRSAGGSGNGDQNVYVGMEAGFRNTSGNNNTFLGRSAGLNNTTGFGNVFIGKFAGINNTIGDNNTVIGANAQLADESLGNATAIGAGSVVLNSNTIALGRQSGVDKVVVYGIAPTGIFQLCVNNMNELAYCSSSRRYKNNINDFRSGLSVINRLRPVTFNWNQTNQADMGLVAEEVAEVDENLVIRNKAGEVEGVKYDRVGVVLVNAVKEQQTEIEAQKARLAEQQKQLEVQKSEIELLKQLVCAQNKTAVVCQQ